MAKRWHPDLAPAGRQFEHERHLKAINEAADQLERIAEGSRGGRVSANAVRASAAAARRAREEAGRRAYEAEQRARAQAAEKASTTRSPAACPTTRSSTATRAVSPIPSGASGTVEGIYFSGQPETGEEVQQWARVRFGHGVRTVPAGSMQLRRLLKARPRQRARRALHDRRAARDGRRRVPAGRAAADVCARSRTAQPDRAEADDARLLERGSSWRRPVARCATGRAWTTGPAAHRFAARIYEEMGAIDLAAQAAERATASGPADAGAWERLGRLRLAMLDREGALHALRRALALGADGQVRELLARALAIEPGRGSEANGSSRASGAPAGRAGAPVAETA